MKLNSNESGFSLIEILVATALLAIITVGIIAALPRGFLRIAQGGRVSTMTHLAYDKIDELKRKAKVNFADTDLTVGSHPATAAGKMVGGDYNGYSVEWVVANGPITAGASTGNMKTITLTVRFQVYDSAGVAYDPPLDGRLSKIFVTYVSE